MTKEIPLTQGKVALVDDDIYPEVSEYKWCAGRSRKTFYAVRTTGGRPRKTIILHREIMSAPPGMEVDHINGNGLDNRRENLRLATRAENRRNSGLQTNSTSGYIGVSWNKNRKYWCASIKDKGKRIDLGHYSDAKDAARAFDAAARNLYGEFARTNFED